MQKEDLVIIVDNVEGAWNLNLTPDRRKALLRAWWRYLSDLSREDVQTVIDDLVVANSPPPRVGDIRRRVIDRDGSNIPSPAIALQQAEDALEAANTGQPVPELHPLVAKALRASHGSLRAFEGIYGREYTAQEQTRYGVKETNG